MSHFNLKSLSCICAFVAVLFSTEDGSATQNSSSDKKDGLLARKWVGNDGFSMNYLSFTPQTHCKTVPLIVYFGGSGEQGDDIRAIMHQKTIFSVVTSKDFQKKHPSCLIAPQLPSGATIHSGLPNCPNALARSLHSLINDFCRAVVNPQIDTNRIYLTGLSLGGSVAFELPAYYPGCFAASVPISTFMNALMVPNERACRYWLFNNKTSFASPSKREALVDLEKRLSDSGGELRVSFFPKEGHNAWDAAWREDATWDWLFAQSVVESHSRCNSSSQGIRCEANFRPAQDNGMSPSNVVDGLSATFFASAEPVGRGAYWLCEYPLPVRGRWRVSVGPHGKAALRKGLTVYVSMDKRRWRRVAALSEKDGSCIFLESHGLRYIKVEYRGCETGPFVLGEVVMLPK